MNIPEILYFRPDCMCHTLGTACARPHARDGRTRATDSTHWSTAALGMATIRRRKGGGDGAEGVDAAGSGVGADVAEAAGGAAAGGGRVRRQRTVAEKLERWGHVFSVVGQVTFSQTPSQCGSRNSASIYI